jgi:uncharacterized protein (DUF934 family)
MPLADVPEITTRRMIRLLGDVPVIVDDPWTVIREESDAIARAEARGNALRGIVLPVRVYLDAMRHDPAALHEAGAWIPPDADFEERAHELLDAPVIAVDFPSFRDGRGLSIGVILRTRFGYRGELLAIGDVLRDQLEYMRRCGFSAFAVRADKSLSDALKGFSEITVRYQGAVGDPAPLFRRRR